jgi:hypothetical protein
VLFKPYKALMITKVCPANSPKSGPAKKAIYSQVLDKRYAEPISPAHMEKPYNSLINITVWRDFSDITEEYVDSGLTIFVKSP